LGHWLWGKGLSAQRPLPFQEEGGSNLTPILKKTEESLKRAGKKVADGTKEVAEGAAGVAKEVGHDTVVAGRKVGRKTVEVTKDVGHRTAAGAGKVAGKLDPTCDNCGKLMTPGGKFTRVIGGKEYQFCSVLCADHFKRPM
jgi:YHS domain-containing protein